MILNSTYADMTFALLYFQERLHTDAWDCAGTEDRVKALKMATRDINNLDFNGCKTVADQELEFPRNGSTEIPDEVKAACCEIAYSRLDGVEPDTEIEATNMTSHSIVGLRTSYDRSSVHEHIAAGIASATAWRLLRPYLRERKEFSICRVS